MKAIRRAHDEDGDRIAWWCPGCKTAHGVPITKWQFNGDFENPTLSPSIGVNMTEPERRCHSFITDGRIQFLTDCYHPLAGQTVDMIDVEQHMVPDHWPADWDAPAGTWRPTEQIGSFNPS